MKFIDLHVLHQHSMKMAFDPQMNLSNQSLFLSPVMTVLVEAAPEIGSETC